MNRQSLSIHEIQETTQNDGHLQVLTAYIIDGQSLTKAEVKQDIQPYWTFHDNMAVIDGIVLKGRRIVIPPFLSQQVVDELHCNHIGTEKTHLKNDK